VSKEDRKRSHNDMDIGKTKKKVKKGRSTQNSHREGIDRIHQ